MTNGEVTVVRRPINPALAASVIMLFVGLLAVLVTSPAQAATGHTSTHGASTLSPAAVRVADTTCPTDYGGGTVPCTTSTTVATNVTLAVTYTNGVITYQVCGYPASAAGTTVQLYLGGQPVSGATSTVQSNGCTPTKAVSQCLAAGTYPVTAIDAGFPTATATLTVTSSGCAAVASAPTTHNGGSLAFTGSNVFRLLVLAAIVILVGLVITAVNRRRRHAH